MYLGTYEAEPKDGKLYLPEKWRSSEAGNIFYFYKEKSPDEYTATKAMKQGAISFAAVETDGAFMLEDVPFLSDCKWILGGGEEMIFICKEDNEYLAGSELYSKLLEGLNDIKNGSTKPFGEVMSEIHEWGTNDTQN